MNLTRRTMLAASAATALARPSFAVTPAKNMGYVDVPGGKVWWRREGAGSKTPLLLLHGGPGAGHNYLLPMKALGADRTVYFYDQLGCGNADAPEDAALYTIPRSVEEIDVVRNALGLERVILFGNSWGGMLAIEYLVSGERKGVEKLVLSGALASVPQATVGINKLVDNMPNGAGKRLRQLEAEGKQQTEEFQSLVGLFYSLHLCRENQNTPEFEATVANLTKSPAYRIMNGPNEFTIVGTIKDWDRTKDLGRITQPTLIMTGEFDEITMDCQQTILSGIAGSKLEVLKGCSHLTMLEKPALHNEIVGGFIA
jgi:proline iminopeptidase